MSNTNVPPSNPNNLGAQIAAEQRAIIEAQTRATRELNGSIRQGVRQLQASFRGFVNPITRLQDSLTRLDQTNRQALALGTTTSKLEKTVSKNSNILERGNVSYQKLIDAITNNFEAGVRVQSGAIADLTEEMIATGQDVNGLRAMNSDLLLFTGDNIKALQDTNRANQEISDKYGVSNQKLIESVNSLRDTFEEASYFGADTTASLESLAKELKARTGGKNVEGAIRTLFGLGTGGLETLTTSLRVGGGGLRSKIAGGAAIGMQDIQPILQEVARIAKEGGGGNLAIGADVAAMRTGLTRQQVIQLVNLNNQLSKDYSLSEEQKKTTDETFNSIQNINERARNFYDKTAVASLAALGSISVTTIQLATQTALTYGLLRGLMTTNPNTPGLAGLLANTGEAIGKAGKVATFAGLAGLAAYGTNLATPEEPGGAKTGLGILERTLTGVSVGAIGGVPGMIAGGVGGLLFGIFESIEQNTKESAEAAKEEQARAARKEREERAMAAARELERVNVLTGYIRSRIDLPYGAEIVPILEDMRKTARQQLATSRQRPGTTAAPK